MARTWWVNQSSRSGPAINEIVWAPTASKARRSIPQHWKNMELVEAGDTIFHYTAQQVVGASTATGRGRPTPKPYVDRSDEDWVEEGLQIPLEYQPLDAPVAKRDIPLDVRLRARTPAGPFDKNGDISQGYLFPVGAELQETLQGLAGIAPLDVEELIEEELAVEGPTDVEQVTYGRAEQRALRKLLLRGRDEAECGLCGQPTSAKYLVAAHIKPRRDCTEEERRDPNIAMLACLMGCDAAFENGDLRVFGNGAMSVTPELRTSRPEWAARFQGARAAIYSDSNAEYFAARSRG